MKSVYIAGPYTAEDKAGEDKNILMAAYAASELLKAGFTVFCPHTMTSIIDREFNEDNVLKWEDWLTTDIYWLAKCDAIFMLPDWKQSKGATLEYMVAKALGLEIMGEVDNAN